MKVTRIQEVLLDLFLCSVLYGLYGNGRVRRRIARALVRPFVWMAKVALGDRFEKACDIRTEAIWNLYVEQNLCRTTKPIRLNKAGLPDFGITNNLGGQK
ncbi:MAG: hypothetical protein DRP79_08710 [Planctomycetota bacterium]|nr:MAG: hypothetical protein DRP79_08710 [Planctomycetota bacterium]